MSTAAGHSVRVIYIGGSGRSGSTLLDLMLGQVSGVVSVGELKFIWQRGLQENQLCGCGASFRECPFWQQVGLEAFGGWERLDLEHILALERSVDRHRFVPLLLAPRLSRPYRKRLEEYTDLLSRLYAAIGRVAGASVVVDSTKHVSYAFLLRRVPGLDLRVVHLVRDSRGVAFSWSKRVLRPEIVDRSEHMPRYSTVRTGMEWISDNLLFHAHARLIPQLRLRYESLVRSPQAELEQIVEGLGASAGELGPVPAGDGTIELGSNHTVAGNPLRFRRGVLALELDEEWRREMPRLQRALVLLLTWPLLLRYRYLT